MMSDMDFVGLPGFLLLLGTIALSLFMYATRNRNYWKNQNVPYVKLAVLLGTTPEYLFKPSHLVEEDLCNKYGRVFGSFEDGNPVLFVTEPEILKSVFVKDFSVLSDRRAISFGHPLLDNMILFAPLDQWRKLRTGTSPALTTNRLRKMSDIIQNCACTMAEHMRKAADLGGDVDIKRFYGHYALGVTSRCAFGAQIEMYSEEADAILRGGKHAFFANVTFSIAMQVIIQRFMDALHVKRFNVKAFDFNARVVSEIVKKRKARGNNHDDLLQFIMNMQEAESPEPHRTKAPSGRDMFHTDAGYADEKPTTVKSLTENEALSQCTLFFISGQDTSSSVLAFTSYLLAINPDAQDKLIQEVDDWFKKHDVPPNYEEIGKLVYLNAVVSESLRLFPPGPRLERTPNMDYILGNTGIKLRKGTTIVIPVYALHRDPELFPDPHAFKPERFLEENINSIHHYSYVPFGAGPRNCLGTRLGLYIVKIGLLHAIRNVMFVPTKNTKVPLEFYPGYGVLAPKNVAIGILKRRL